MASNINQRQVWRGSSNSGETFSAAQGGDGTQLVPEVVDTVAVVKVEIGVGVTLVRSLVAVIVFGNEDVVLVVLVASTWGAGPGSANTSSAKSVVVTSR